MKKEADVIEQPVTADADSNTNTNTNTMMSKHRSVKPSVFLIHGFGGSIDQFTGLAHKVSALLYILLMPI